MDFKLKEDILNEIEEFREIGHKFLNGELNKAQFKKASGKMCAYAHRDGKSFMVRLRTVSGVIPIKTLEFIHDLTKKYDLENVHLTTRQAVQLHGVSIDNVCDVLKESLEFGICSRGAGGDNPRNVAISPLSGVKIGEAFDVISYAFAINDNFMRQITSYHLPRKLKVAVSNDIDDEGHVTAVDLGFLAVKDGDENKFKVFIGGGLGRNPRIGIELETLINPEDVVYHVEAMTSLFMAEGDYNNHGKARIRYIAERMGEEEFKNCYSKHLEEAFKKYGDTLKVKPSERKITKSGVKTDIKSFRLVEQKQESLYSVYVKPQGGQFKTLDLEKVLNAIKNLEDVELRLTMTEGFYIVNLNGEEAKEILDLTDSMTGKTRLENSVSCIGVPTCQMGAMESQSLLKEILKYFKENNMTEDILPRLSISGCANSCTVHELMPIGFAGKMKRVDGAMQNAFELHVGGKLEVGKTKLGTHVGEILQVKIPEYLMEIAKELKKENMEFEDWFENNKERFQSITSKYLV
ncbi:MAG: nitrite/sulfite reductase [Clostridium perfringens]|nr:nitrite/sulfite reductase [Clostridium perfringens]